MRLTAIDEMAAILSRSAALLGRRRCGRPLGLLGAWFPKTPKYGIAQPCRPVAAQLVRSGAESLPKIVLDTKSTVRSLSLTALAWRHDFPSRCPYTKNGTPLDVYIHESIT